MGGLFNATLGAWGGRWHVSGMAVSSDEGRAAADDAKRKSVYCAYNAGYRDKVAEIAVKYHEAEREYFGAPLMTFPDATALEAGLNGFYAHRTAQLSAENGKEPVEPPVFSLDKDFPRLLPAALFLPPGDNEEIVLVHERIAELLSRSDAGDITDLDLEFVAEGFASVEISAEYWRYLRRTYGPAMMSALLLTPCTEDSDFEAVLRIYKPADFAADKLPRFTVADW